MCLISALQALSSFLSLPKTPHGQGDDSYSAGTDSLVA